jgi:ATP-dependent DNA helicase DinG
MPYKLPDRPTELGFPDKYDYWRKHQAAITEKILNSQAKVIILNAPTGSGKSGIALAAARILAQEGKKTTILTHQINLQDQYVRDYGFQYGVQLKSATGRKNWDCILEEHEEKTAATAPCTEGYECIHSTPTHPGVVESIECPYYRQKEIAAESLIRVLNYPLFLESLKRSNSFGGTELLFCDEGHHTDKAILEVISTTLTKEDFYYLRLVQAPKFPKVYQVSLKHNPHVLEWTNKAQDRIRSVSNLMEKQGSVDKEDTRRVLHKLSKIKELQPGGPGSSIKAAVVIAEDGQVKIRPVLSDEWADKLLIAHAHKTVLMSATIFDPRYWESRLGLREGEAEYLEMPSTYPVESRQVFYSPIVSVNNERMMKNQDELQPLVDEMDRIIGGYLPRKGIVHTVSRKFAYFLRDRSKWSKIMFVGGKEIVEDFKAASIGVLVSYSATEGLDLPDDLCRYTIIAKVPWPPKNDPVIQVQMEEIPGFYDYETASGIVQGVGRGMRSETDWCMSYILDKSFGMLWYKAKDMWPEWFKEAVVWCDKAPLPERS